MNEPDTTPEPRSDAVPPKPTLTLRSGEHGAAVSDTLWEQVGGTPTFERIVHDFYEGVRGDSLLAPMYPQDDWEGSEWRLRAFLEQYWGGPTTYSDQRGHPRLRLRHAPYPVTPGARDRWLAHMRTAVDGLGLAPAQHAQLWDYLERAAHSMVNAPTMPA